MDSADTTNSVKVLSIDEEKRKFRVIFTSGTPAGIDSRHGRFKFNLPPPTSIANSDEYRQALIKVDYVSANPEGPVDATWTLGTGAGQAIQIGGVIVKLNAPSGQVVHNKIFAVADYDKGVNDHTGFQQFVPLEAKNIGSLLLNAAGPAGAGVPQQSHIAWQGDGTGCEGVICGNPFHQQLELSLMCPNVDFTPCYLSSPAGGGGLLNMIGTYVIQLSIEMIPNK